MQWHPNKNSQNKAKATRLTIKLNEAYEILGNQALRAQYDTFLANLQVGGYSGPCSKFMPRRAVGRRLRPFGGQALPKGRPPFVTSANVRNAGSSAAGSIAACGNSSSFSSSKKNCNTSSSVQCKFACYQGHYQGRGAESAPRRCFVCAPQARGESRAVSE